jgi:hypothetical protein
LNFFKSIVGIVTFVHIKPFYAINSDDMSLFAKSSFLVFNEFEHVLISIDFTLPIWKNEYCCFFSKKKEFFTKKQRYSFIQIGRVYQSIEIITYSSSLKIKKNEFANKVTTPELIT